MKIRIWHTIFITFNYAATIDLKILFSLHMRHLSKEQVACARLIIAFFFLYSEIEMIVPPIILTNPLLPHKSFQFMCMILKQEKSTKHRISMRKTRGREGGKESKPQKGCCPRYTGEVQLEPYRFFHLRLVNWDLS